MICLICLSSFGLWKIFLFEALDWAKILMKINKIVTRSSWQDPRLSRS